MGFRVKVECNGISAAGIPCAGAWIQDDEEDTYTGTCVCCAEDEASFSARASAYDAQLLAENPGKSIHDLTCTGECGCNRIDFNNPADAEWARRSGIEHSSVVNARTEAILAEIAGWKKGGYKIAC